LLYVAALHLLAAGAIAGSAVKIRALLVLAGLVLAESIALGLVRDTSAGLWALTNIPIVQVGYLVGIYGRATLERAGYGSPSFRPRRSR
jgi:hypothetical protein